MTQQPDSGNGPAGVDEQLGAGVAGEDTHEEHALEGAGDNPDPPVRTNPDDPEEGIKQATEASEGR